MLVKIEAYHDGKWWCGRGLGEDFFTQGRTLDELLQNIKDAAALHFDDRLPRGEALNVLLISETEIRRGKTAAG
jgi:predicted RNase H-like HicB family nuclease